MESEYYYYQNNTLVLVIMTKIQMDITVADKIFEEVYKIDPSKSHDIVVTLQPKMEQV